MTGDFDAPTCRARFMWDFFIPKIGGGGEPASRALEVFSPRETKVFAPPSRSWHATCLVSCRIGREAGEPPPIASYTAGFLFSALFAARRSGPGTDPLPSRLAQHRKDPAA